MTPKKLADMTEDDIKQAVREKYSQVAEAPCEHEFNFPVGRNFAESVGYPPEVLDALPRSMSESFTGAGNPQPHVDPRPDETLLDVGCGVGLDLYFYAKAITDGHLYGLDLSESMLSQAQENLLSVGCDNVTFLCAPADDIPLPDESVDTVTANGIYNLSPDKEAIMREVYRVLKPGGRTIFAEIVLKAALPEEIRTSADDWFRCIGGALPEQDFLDRMEYIGFRSPQVLWKGRNARTGHELAEAAVIRAEK